MTAMAAQDFNRYTGKAKLLAQENPLFITEWGEVKFVLLSIKDYQNLKEPNSAKTLNDIKGMSEDEYVDFEIPRLDWTWRELDLS